MNCTNKNAAVGAGGTHTITSTPSYPINSAWRRTNRKHPCPICGHPKWCSTSADGAAAICMRESAGSVMRTRNGGYLHRLRDVAPRPSPSHVVFLPDSNPSRGDLPLLARRWQTAISPARLQRLAEKLGLSVASLRRLGIGWTYEHEAWSFPMANAEGRIVGIRLRRDNGHKFAVTGGREGLFIPAGLPSGDRLLIAEGPTDCAALLDWGFAAIGRPSCTGGTRLLIELLKQRKPQEVVIVADGDGPGQEGAYALAAALVAYSPAVRVITPPAGVKDARAWKQAGAAAAHVQAAIDAAPVQTLTIRAKNKRKEVHH